MSQLEHAIRRGPRRMRLAACALIVAIVAVSLVWIGRASAKQSAPTGVSTIVSNVATGKADAVYTVTRACTVSPLFNPMPEMSKTFSFGGTASRPVIVLFQGAWSDFTEGTAVFIRLTIDGVPVGPVGLAVNIRHAREGDVLEANGANFVSDPLTPGTHTATIQWADNGVGPGCVNVRSLIILHK